MSEAMSERALRADEALRDLQARVDNAQALAGMGDYDWHVATDVNTWSDQLFRIYGLEPGAVEPTYERFLSFVHPDDQDRVRAVHQQAYATGAPYEMVERIVRPTGEVRYLSSNGEVVTDASGTPVRFRGTCVDITERVLAEQERAELDARRRAALEINDSVVQGLTAALYALELEDSTAVHDYVRRTLDAARAIITDLVGPGGGPIAPGDLVRAAPSSLA